MWELFTTGGGDFYRIILNGVAMIFGDDDYIVALKIAAMIGLLVVLVRAAFQKDRMDLQWILGVILIYMATVVPKVDVIITDRAIPANSAVVGNVPIGLAATATVISRFSDWGARTMEVVFSLPNEINYSGNGMLFGNALVEQSTQFQITSSRIATNYSEFWKSCVYYDLLLNLYTWDSLVRATDIMDFLANNTSQTRRFPYTANGGGTTMLECRSGISNEMATDLDSEIASTQQINGARLVPGETTVNNAVSRFASTMPVAYQYYTGLSLTSSQILGQSVLANSLEQGLSSFASDADAPAAAQAFAMAKAEAERATTMTAMGHLAKKMLPRLHILFMAIVMAMFPIVILMSMTGNAGKVALGYVKVLAWLALWPMLFAVLHFAMAYWSQAEASNAVMQGCGFSGAGACTPFPNGLTVFTHTALGAAMRDNAAIAGYLMMSIPMISWLIISQSGAMLAGLAGRLMEGYERPTSGAAEETASGNIRSGTLQYQTASAFANNSSVMDDRGMIQERLGSGTMQTTTGSGDVFQSAQQSSSSVGVQLQESMVQQAQQDYTNSVQSASMASTDLAQSNSAVLRDTNAVMETLSNTAGTTNTFSESETNSYTQSMQELDSVVRDWAEKNDIQMSDAVIAQVYAGADVKAGTPLGGLVGSSASASAGTKVTGQTSELDNDTLSKIETFRSSEQFSSAITNVGQAARQMAASFGLGESDQTVDGLSSSLDQQTTASERYTESLSNVEAARDSLASSQSVAETISLAGMDSIKQHALDSGMSPSQWDGTVTAATRGDAGALDTIKFIAMDGHVTGNVDPVDYESFSSSIAGRHQEASSRLSDEGAVSVDMAGIGAESTVQGASQVSRDQVESASDRAMAGISESMDSPAGARTQNGTTEQLSGERTRLSQEGGGIEQRIQGAHDAEDDSVLPFTPDLDKFDSPNKED